MLSPAEKLTLGDSLGIRQQSLVCLSKREGCINNKLLRMKQFFSHYSGRKTENDTFLA